MMTRRLAALALALCAVSGSAMAQESVPIPNSWPLPSVLFEPGISAPPEQFAPHTVPFTAAQPYVTKGLVAMEQARSLCFRHPLPTGTLLGCIPERMCNRAYEQTWKELCWEIDRQWSVGGYAAQADREQQEQDKRDMEFVRAVAKEGRK